VVGHTTAFLGDDIMKNFEKVVATLSKSDRKLLLKEYRRKLEILS